MSHHPFSKRLKQARLAAKLSQKRLGIAAGIDEFSASARMNQYETGKHMPDFSTVERIAKVLDVQSSFFFTTDDTLAKIIACYGRLDKKGRQQLLEFASKITG